MSSKGVNLPSKFKNSISNIVSITAIQPTGLASTTDGELLSGPIVRINPTELHIFDPNFHEIAYSSSKAADKLLKFRDRFGLPKSIQSTRSS